MRGVFVTFLITLITPYMVHALDCKNYGAQSTCNLQPKCEWTNSGCISCIAGHYCDGTVDSPKDCPLMFPLSAKGAAAASECYRNVNCSDDNNVTNCKDYNDGLSAVYCNNEHIPSAHIDGTSGTTCYTNNRSCSNFSKSGCTGTVTGTATYDASPDINRWIISACECIETNVEYTDKHCKAQKTYKPSSNNIQAVADGITYNMSNYFCTGCIGGYYVTASDITPVSFCTGNTIPCSCSPVTQGYYMSACIWGSSWNNNCTQPHPCPAGQTTNGTAAASVSDCHYTANTKFCDTGGCFTLGDIENAYGIASTEWQLVGN